LQETCVFGNFDPKTNIIYPLRTFTPLKSVKDINIDGCTGKDNKI
jgi:hypothetical protein